MTQRRRDNIIGAIGAVTIVIVAAGVWEWWSPAQSPPAPPPLVAAVAATGNLPGPGVVPPIKIPPARLAMLADSARKYPLPDNWPRNVRKWKSVMEPNGDMYLVPGDPDPLPDRFLVSIAIRKRDGRPFELAEPSDLAAAAAVVLREKQPMNPGRMQSFGEGVDRSAGVEFLGWDLAINSVEPIGKDGWRAEVQVSPQRAFGPSMMVMGNVHLEVYRYVDGKLTLESQRPGPHNESPIDETLLRGQGNFGALMRAMNAANAPPPGWPPWHGSRPNRRPWRDPGPF
jgi:hypothetical protein